MAKVALITGGNGITGSAVLEYLVKNTTADEWSKIIVTSRSPFKTIVQDSRITFIALDLSNPSSILVQRMSPICAEVTHAYFSSYIHKDDFAELNKANETLFSNSLDALIEVAPNLQNCTLQTGGKHYNVHIKPVSSPAREDEPRTSSPLENFYYPQEDYLLARQAGQPWTWTVIRPEAIIGHTSKPNGMNSALTYALYFLVCRHMGTGANMPTNQIYWDGYDDLSDSRLIADMTIWASTTPKAQNHAFNVTNGDYLCWRYMWPRLAAYFGASASSEQKFEKPRPKEGDTQLEFSLAEWAADKREVWERICDESGCPEAKGTWDKGTWAFQDWVFQRTWSATLSVNKARRMGRNGHIDSYRSLVDAFEKFVELKQMPPMVAQPA